MKRTDIIKAITAVLMAFVIVFVAIPYGTDVYAVDTSKEAEQALEDKIDSLQSEQAELKKKLEAAKNNEAEQERQKEYLDSLVLSTQNEIDATKLLIEEYTLKIENKGKEIEALEEKIDQKYDIMVERLRFTYEEGNASYLEMIFEAKSFADFLMTVERVGSMLDFDRSLMQELQDSLKALEEEKYVLEETKKSQEETKTSLVNKEADLKKQIDNTLAYIEKLQSDQVALEAEYKKAKAAEDQANKDIAALLAQRAKEQAAANKNNSTEYRPVFGGKFIWPVPGYARISSPYGPRTLWGRYDFHLGIDIPAPSGTNIYASAAGEVLIATYHYSYGYYCLIDHGDGFATLYAHNSQLLVSAGQIVEQGQHIAEMGTTGSSSGNHLHFEVRVNGSTVNPQNYVSP
ncbi:MAG: peptidoglycan DD-metalloendopeptidase family protein [Clostridia bacterium]|nr:peptidoglycan DD-metalloendopeptidase family protein [Clostridia bacterium]